MSTDWQFRCKKCHQTDWCDAHREESNLRLLLRAPLVLKNLIICAHVLRDQCSDDYWSWDAVISCNELFPIDLTAFDPDCEHEFEGVSEYGHIIGEDGVCHDPPHWEKK